MGWRRGHFWFCDGEAALKKSVKELSVEDLDRMEKLGFELFGSIFGETLAYVQIQRRRRMLK